MRQQRRIGDIYRIDLGDSTHCYAMALAEASFAFFDFRTSDDHEVNEIRDMPVLFKIAVMKHAVTRGRWKRVGHVSLSDAEARPPAKFIRDRLCRGKYQIYENGQIRNATREECEGLEAAAVWEPEHVEDRLRDFYAGRPNKWVESLRL
jgi:hypothetical protein